MYIDHVHMVVRSRVKKRRRKIEDWSEEDEEG
jgi:hypothetical protein